MAMLCEIFLDDLGVVSTSWVATLAFSVGFIGGGVDLERIDLICEDNSSLACLSQKLLEDKSLARGTALLVTEAKDRAVSARRNSHLQTHQAVPLEHSSASSALCRAVPNPASAARLRHL
jgi:hypothetical protein